MKKMMAILVTFAMIMVMCSCAVMAEETAPAETGTAEAAATGEEDEAVTEVAGETGAGDSTSEVPEEPEIIHIAAGDELPDYFYAVPKEKILKKGEFSLEALHAYVAIEVKKYLDENGLSIDDFYSQYNEVDLITMKGVYRKAIKLDKFSYALDETCNDLYYTIPFTGDDKIINCVVRAVFVYCETVGYEREKYLDVPTSLFELFELDPGNITFSEEQLNYFEE